jgi:AraC-like DNA-binding protein
MFLLFIPEDILYSISGLGILQGFFLAALVYFHPKSDKSVNIYLALYIFCLSCLIAMPLYLKVFSWRTSGFLQPLPMLIGPLLYLYLRSFKEKITFKKAWPHFIVFVLFIIPISWHVSRMSAKYPDAENIPPEILTHPVTMSLMYARLVHLIIYYFLGRKVVQTYERSIEHLFSETSRISLKWARVLLNGHLLLFITVLVIFTLMFRYPDRFNLFLLTNMSIATVFIYIATFKSIAQPTLWQIKASMGKEELEHEMHEAETMDIHTARLETPKLVRPANDDRMEAVITRITDLMEKEKMYHEPELTLRQLSDKLGLPTYQVSQMINDGMNRNFYNLINTYRVEEAKQLLLEPGNRNYTILSIGFEAGFNSKTTFNTVFKKFTGLTPTEYRETYWKQMAEATPLLVSRRNDGTRFHHQHYRFPGSAGPVYYTSADGDALVRLQ